MAVLANFLGPLWRWLSPPPGPEDADVFTAFPPPPAPGRNPPPAPGRPARKFDDIRAAVENRLNYLARQEIPEHREIARRDVLELHYIEIECPGNNGEALLNSFFKDFNPAARQDWIRELLGGNAAVKLDCFAGIHASADLPATGIIDKHEQMLSQGVAPAYAVHVWGQWVQAAAPPEPGATSGPPVVFRVLDGQGQRPEVRKATYPLSIGRGGGCDVAVAGTFASGDHCGLYAGHGRIWLEDHSKNGTWLDGQKAPPGQRVELDANRRHRLKLGRESGEAKDCPEIELEFLGIPSTPVAGATPIDTAGATPVIAPAGQLLAVLSIADATGNPMRDVLRLPFTIGRAEDRDYATPPAHAGISGKHLSIAAITADGARVSNEAHEKNGTALDGAPQPAEFLWPFDAEIVLAPKWPNDPPVLITLKRPG